MYIFLQEMSNMTNREFSKDSLSQYEFHCQWVVDLKLPLPQDLISCISRVKRTLWIGTEKGCVAVMDLRKVADEFGIDYNKMFFVRSNRRILDYLRSCCEVIRFIVGLEQC